MQKEVSKSSLRRSVHMHQINHPTCTDSSRMMMKEYQTERRVDKPPQSMEGEHKKQRKLMAEEKR